jgi:hypothetical protein
MKLVIYNYYPLVITQIYVQTYGIEINVKDYDLAYNIYPYFNYLTILNR